MLVSVVVVSDSAVSMCSVVVPALADALRSLSTIYKISTTIGTTIMSTVASYIYFV